MEVVRAGEIGSVHRTLGIEHQVTCCIAIRCLQGNCDGISSGREVQSAVINQGKFIEGHPTISQVFHLSGTQPEFDRFVLQSGCYEVVVELHCYHLAIEANLGRVVQSLEDTILVEEFPRHAFCQVAFTDGDGDSLRRHHYDGERS